MLLSPSMWPRIIRITILSAIGLLLTYACGVRTMGTMAVYCCLIHLYSDTLTGGRNLLKKRLLIIAISIPIMTALLFLLSLAQLHEMVRTPLAVLLGVPLLLGINHHFKFGFSEISQVVTVAILAVSFEGNHFYFLYRIAFTTIGILVSYLTYEFVFPLRHDVAFEKEYAALRKELCELINLVYVQEEAAERAGTLYRSCQSKYEITRKHLDIIRADLYIKRQYQSWKPKIPHYLWQMDCIDALLKLLEQMLAHQENAAYTLDCRNYVLKEGWWAAGLLGLSEGDRAREAGRQGNVNRLSRGLAQVRTSVDLQMLCLLERLESQAFDEVEHSSHSVTHI